MHMEMNEIQTVWSIENPLKPSPSDGGGLGGGENVSINTESYLTTLPLIPSHQGRGNGLSDSLLTPL